MENKVIVTALNGAVVRPAKTNPTIGFIRVSQSRFLLNNHGFGKTLVLSALVVGPINDIINLNWVEGQELEGKIVVKEGITPFDLSKPDRDLKRISKDGDVCTYNGFPIYRRTIYTTNLNEADVFLTSDRNYNVG